MIVKEYFVEEVKNLNQHPENLAEWHELVDKLDLEGQRTLMAGDEKSPIPFVLLNSKYDRIYSVLCPSKMEYKKYDKTTIPLRVLALIGLCKEKEYFGSIQIWYDDKSPCPVVVGCDGQEKYLIARWGSEAIEEDALEEKAKHRKKTKMIADLNKALKSAENQISVIDSYIETWFDGNWIQAEYPSW